MEITAANSINFKHEASRAEYGEFPKHDKTNSNQLEFNMKYACADF